MSLLHNYLCCCFVGGWGGGGRAPLRRAPLCYLCSEKAKCICVSCKNEMCVWRPVFCMFFGLGDRFLCAGVCCHLPWTSDWAIASWVLGCAAIYRQNTGLLYTHISRTRSWHFSYVCSRWNAYLAQTLLPLAPFLCGYPRRNTFWVFCMWEPTLLHVYILCMDFQSPSVTHNTLVVSRHSMTTKFLYMSSV
jgi:hypothetical protein